MGEANLLALSAADVCPAQSVNVANARLKRARQRPQVIGEIFILKPYSPYFTRSKRPMLQPNEGRVVNSYKNATQVYALMANLPVARVERPSFSSVVEFTRRDLELPLNDQLGSSAPAQRRR
jgi:hypothetical protein